MKWLKVLLCAVLIVAVFTVPCFATNEGFYRHYISPGTYLISDSIDFSYLYIAANGRYSLVFDFVSGDMTYSGFYFAKGVDNSIYQLAYLPDHNTVYSTYGDVTGWINSSYRSIEILDGFYIDDINVFSWWASNVIRSDGVPEMPVLDGMLSIFGFVGGWIVEASSDLAVMFWDPTEGSLTFVGTLAVSALALAVSFLIIGLIQRFLKFKG